MQPEQSLQDALSYAVTGVTTTNTLSLSFASAIGLAEVTNPKLKNIYERYTLRNFSVVCGPEDSTELGELLVREDPTLEEKRIGAWQTLASGSADALSQAANSMREVLRVLISKYASNNDVKTCSWWVPAPDAENDVSRAQRLRLLIYGGNEGAPASDDVEVLDAEIDRFDRAFKVLTKMAHGSSIATKHLVETEMRTLESLILILLKRRRQEQADYAP